MKFTTDQEGFWAGKFGDNYIPRNESNSLITANIALFSRILTHLAPISSMVEFGPNIGNNILAIRTLQPDIDISAVEINKKAIDRLKKIANIDVHHGSMLNFDGALRGDFVLVKGVLIHIDPHHLPKAYELLYQSSNRYICLAEYYNPSPTEVVYRGHEGKLFKRDFAGDMLNTYDDLDLVDYGFVYHRDRFPQDDLTWFVLEKRKRGH